jgi:chromosome segregation ATPase
MGLKIAAVMFILMAGMAGIGYWYYNDSQAKMAVLVKNAANAETASKISEQALVSMKKDYARVTEELNSVNSKFSQIRTQNSVLAKKLQKLDDLGEAAIAKTESIQRAINGGTKNAGRCFEILSGSPFTVREKEAKDAKSFNKECPWLWPGNTSTQ